LVTDARDSPLPIQRINIKEFLASALTEIEKTYYIYSVNLKEKYDESIYKEVEKNPNPKRRRILICN